MRSMTGFGSACGGDASAGVSFRIEISSINRKQFELKCSLPREIAVYEGLLRNVVAEKVSRGSLLMRVEVRAFQSSSGNASGEAFDLSLAERYAEMAKVLQDRIINKTWRAEKLAKELYEIAVGKFYKELKEAGYFVEHEGEKEGVVFFSQIKEIAKKFGVEVENE